MIIEYFDEFMQEFNYPYLNSQCVTLFDGYLLFKGIQLCDAKDHIENFTEGLPVSSQTKRNYRTRLRRFIEYILEQEDVG